MSKQADVPTSQQQPLAAIIKDEIVLIGSLVFFVGIISTDAYYSRFDISYQFLDLPTFHIIYRGITIVLYSPWLFLPYVLAIVWFVLESVAKKKQQTLLHYRALGTYILLLLLLAISYPLARRAGNQQAQRDLYKATSRLPKIVYLKLKSGEEFNLGDGYCLLVIDANYVVLLKPLEATETAALPNIKRFSKEDAHVIETIH